MMKPLLTATFVSVIALSACSKTAETLPPATTSSATVLSDIQKSFPVTLSKIADGVWVHTSNYSVPSRAPIPSNGLIVADGDELIMVDSAWGELATLSLLETVKSEIGKPVTKLVITHHHYDRVAGVDLLESQGVTVFTHPDTPILAAKQGNPVPNTSVAALKEKGSRTKIGNIEVSYPGPGHAQENLVVYVPSDKILFGGCAIKGGEAATLGNIDDADIKAWPTSLAWVKQTYPDTQLVVPGHGKGGDMKVIDHTLMLLAKAVNDDAKQDTEN